jgi:uncharacterized membrane protein (UPF0182 family)
VGDFLRRRLAVVIIVAIVLVVLFANRIAVFLTDWWWYRAIGASEVFAGSLWARIGLGAVAALVLGALIAANLVIARRMRPLVVPSTPQQAVIEQYRAKADPYLPWLILAIAVAFGLSSGVAAATQWRQLLLFLNATPFGTTDPQFDLDIAFYVFRLPFWRFVQGWLFTSLLLVMLLSAGAHLLLGGIRPDAPAEKVLPAVKAHLSVLLALTLAARGWGYWLDRYMLNFSPRGTVTGASYTDVNAELPALNLLLIVTAVAIVLTLVNLRRRGFLLPGAAIGILVLASILLQGAYPALIQRLRVDPQELARERTYIDRNKEATTTAYGLADVELQPFSVVNDLDQQQVEDNEVTFNNVRLWDPELLEDNYQQLQALRPYYTFANVDIDRYMVDGELRQVMLSARELDDAEVPSAWQNRYLTFTHGLGIVSSQVNATTAQGQPVFLSRDIPPRTNASASPDGALVPDERFGIYYGEVGNPEYSIVRTDQPELDYERPDTQEQVTTTYDGEGGVTIGNRLRRLAFALRFSDPNFVLSGLLNVDSTVLYNRNVQERVSLVAPYLTLDSDPYPAVIEERIVWIQDAYTTTQYYPYSERRALVTNDEVQTVNYVRNSVKAVVDAYDGTVTLYQINDDPIATTWRKAFGDLYADLEDAPDGLREHFRYPEDLFELQTRLYTTYHIPNVDAFYTKADEWEIPRDAAALENNPSLDEAQAPLDPYYLLFTLPSQTEEEFVLIQPYVPKEKENMIAWLAARSDPEHYGELYAVQFPTDSDVLGPRQAHGRIEQESEIAREITLVDQAGSELIRGNLLVLPVEESLVFVEPLFLQNPQSRIPELWQVVLVMGDRVVMRPTLDEALEALIEAGPPIDDGASGPSEPGDDDEATSDDPTELLTEALVLFNDADAALREGELGEYQRLIARAQRLLERVAELQGADVPEPEPTETPEVPAPDGDGTEPAAPTEPVEQQTAAAVG